jgi:nucleotide-binding universal stress UspA family protein
MQSRRTMDTPIGNVLVATDFTRHAHDAAARAAWLPIGQGCEITLAHTVPAGLPALVEASLYAAARALMRGAEATIAQEARRAGRPVPPVFTSIETGQAAENITALARHRRSEVIVIGHGERRSIGERILGSTAERIVRLASCSVLLVVDTPAAAYRHALVGVDLTDASQRAVEMAARLVAPKAARLDIVHVYEAPYLEMLQSGGMTQAEIDQYFSETEESAGRLVAAWVPALRELGVATPVRLRRGPPRRVLLEEAAAQRADLLAVGHRGRSTASTLLLGSVAEAMARYAPCDVLVTR